MTRHPLKYKTEAPLPYALITDTDETPTELILGKFSAQVMQAVWSYPDDEFTVRDIVNTMKSTGYQGRYTAVQNAMHRLLEAGILENAPKSRDKDPRALNYATCYSAADLIRTVVRRLTR